MMKGKKQLLLGLVFGILIGWVFGFLRFPYLEKNVSFLLGFIASLIFVSLLLMIWVVWNRRSLHGLIAQKEGARDSQSTSKTLLIWMVLSGIVALGSIVIGLNIYRENRSFKLQIQNHDSEMLKMKATIELLQKTNQEPLMSNILEEVGEELKRNPARTLTDATINKIASLSSFLQSYQFIEQDSLSKKKYSKERGQLLQALLLMNIDSSSFAQIKRQAVFAEADLRGADLKGLDLSGISLKDAHLKDADLSGTNLKGANLGGANLWGANLNRANLSNADLQMADLTWAQLNEATLSLVNLNEASLLNAQLRKADLNHASFRFAQSGGAMLNEANLTNVILQGSNFTKANLSQADLSDSQMGGINFSEANLTGVQLSNAMVDGDWSEKLKEWHPIGEKELSKSYTVEKGTFGKFNNPVSLLRKMGK
ncbi:MAG: pentapeptide repeat-containing protein [Saprospiraceae bacterium]|nr:pentapeptide repeat-containing protein [Saprospiraceae bacterium]